MSGGRTGSIMVAAVGRMKRSIWQAAQDDYLNRLQRYTTISLAEVKDSVGRGFPDAVAIEREGEALLKVSSDVNRRFLITPTGKALTSPRLARYLQGQIEQFSSLAFLVGGPLGFSAEVEATVDEQISLSRLTFPHELARVILLEQLYRAFTITRGEPYHK